MKSKTVLFFLALTVIVNLYLFVKRNDYTFHKQVAYNELYPSAPGIPLNKIRVEQDSFLSFSLSPALAVPVKWTYLVSGNSTNSTSVSPKIPLRKGLWNYIVFSDGTNDSIHARVEYIPGAANGDKPFIGLYKLEIGKCAGKPAGKEVAAAETILPDQKKQLKEILFDSIKLTAVTGTEEKVRMISIYLHNRLAASAGDPVQSTIAANPFEQYKLSSSGSKIWCGIYARIFEMFSRAAGIRTRTIELKGTFENVENSDHVINEIYIPEKRQWAATDLMYNNIMYENGFGRLLNAVEVKNTSVRDSTVSVVQADADTVIKKNFSSLAPAYYDLYGRDKEMYIYYGTETAFNEGLYRKIRNYFTASYWYVIYSDIRITGNRGFYTRQVLFLLLISWAIWYSSLFIKNFLKKKNDRI